VNEETADIMNLRGAEVVAAARQYLDPARYIKVTLMPEATR